MAKTENKDQDIMKMLTAGDDRAIELLFDTYFTPLCQRVNRIVNNPVIAEDLVQDVFYTFWMKRFEIAIERSPASYLYRMTLNAAFSYLRKYQHIAVTELNEKIGYSIDRSPSGEETFIFSELQEKINRIIQSLPPKCKLIFTMSRNEEMSNKEIAEQLNISVKTVENQMTKALQIFRSNLSPFIPMIIGFFIL